jgi:hypothetical protein
MSRAERLAPLSAFFVTGFIAVAFILGGETPSTGDSAAKVVNFYSDNKDQVFISSVLVTLGGISLVWFAASLRAHIRRREGDPGRLAALPLAAAILIAVGITIFAGIEASAADAVDDIPASGMQTLNALDNNMFFTLAGGSLLMFASLAVAILRFGVFPRWLGWVSVILAIASLTPLGFFAFLLSGIYYPLMGWLIYREQGAAPSVPTAPTEPRVAA